MRYRLKYTTAVLSTLLSCLLFSVRVFCTDQILGFKLIIFNIGAPYAPEVITGKLPSEYSRHLPYNLRRELFVNNTSIHVYREEDSSNIFYLLAFTTFPAQGTSQSSNTEPPPAKKKAVDFKHYEETIPWPQQFWLQSFSQSSHVILTQSSPVFTIPFDAGREQEWQDFLDAVVYLSRWILNQQATAGNADNLLVIHARELLQLLADPEAGGVCGHTDFISDISSLVSESGNNILTACLYAGAALNAPQLTDWMTAETSQYQLSLLVQTEVNVLELVLHYFPGLFEHILRAYSDHTSKLKALKRENEKQLNVLAVACSEHPELIGLIMASCLNDEEKKSLVDPGKNGWNVLCYAASSNAQSIQLLLQHLPENDLPALLATHEEGKDNVLLFSIYHTREAVPSILGACKNRKYEILTYKGLCGYNPLMLAIEEHLDLMTVQRLIREYQSCDALTVALETTSQEQRNLLLLAIDFYPELIGELVDLCPNQKVLAKLLSGQDQKGENSLMRAILGSKPELVPFLINLCTDNQTLSQMLTAQNKDGHNSLIMAIRYGYTDLVQTILSACPMPQTRSTVPEADNVVQPAPTQSCLSQILTQRSLRGINALGWVIRSSNSAVAAPLLQPLIEVYSNADVLEAIVETNHEGRNVIMIAAQYMPEAMESLVKLCLRDQERIRRMLSARERSNGGWSVLEHAVGFHNNRYVLALLERAMVSGIFTDESDRVQRRALEYCNARVLRYLRSRSISLVPSREMFARMSEEEKRERDDCRHVIQVSLGSGFQGLLAAVLRGDLKQTRQELRSGGNANQRHSSGDSLLHIAVVGHNSPDMVHELLTHGADITIESHGYTPLQAACLFSGECIVALLSASLDRNIIRGCRNSFFQGFLIPRIFHRGSDNKLLCAICHDSFEENEVPVLLPCLHQMYCRQCLVKAQKHQNHGWHRYVSFEPFRCYLCKSVTRYVIDWSVRALEYIAQLRRRAALGENEWKKYYPQNEDQQGRNE